MKRIHFLYLLLLPCMFFQSCLKSDLDELPTDTNYFEAEIPNADDPFVVDSVPTVVVNGPAGESCRPTVYFHIDEAYAAAVRNLGFYTARVIVSQESSTSTLNEQFDGVLEPGSRFSYTDPRTYGCGTATTHTFELLVISRETGNFVASVKKTVAIPVIP